MNELEQSKINYTKVLSAVAYDMRNSLTIMFQSLQGLSTQDSQDKVLTNDEVADINYQVQRLNGGLTQLMALYNLDQDKLMINVTEQLVEDVLESVICQNDLYTQSKNINISMTVKPDLTWGMDVDLIAYLIDDVLSNAIRYSKEAINISAFIKDGYLNIVIDDDSQGYPEQMLSAATAPINSLVADYGRIGIGLLFSKLIVLSHENRGRYGRLDLSNTSPMGGSSFVVQLP